jgi:hypothetical protein
MPRKFHVVKTADSTAVFDDLDTLRQVAPTLKRTRTTETFARIPHERAFALPRLPHAGWIILIELDRLILKGRGRNPVRLTNHRLRELGIDRRNKRRYLRQLETAGIVRVLTEARKWTMVTLLWFPSQD